MNKGEWGIVAVIVGVFYGVVATTAYRFTYPCKTETELTINVTKALLWQRTDSCSKGETP